MENLNRVRFVYGGLVIIVCIAIAAIVSYRTSGQSSPAMPSSMTEFGGVSLRIEYATTSAERERGLGGRATLAPDAAMLFVFPRDDFYGFWMKDTLVPLDMFWLDDKGQVISIAHDVATSSFPEVFYPTLPARYVLETVAGFAQTHHIATGTPYSLKNLPGVSK